MHFTSLILSTLAIVPLGAFAWAKAGNGVWIANNKVYERVGNYNKVHEACTRMNSQTVLASGACAYWANGQGKINDGYCVAYKNNNGVDCKIGCPNSFDPCQYLEDDGTCSFGYMACLQKMGCGGRGGQADCIGTATGCAKCA